MWNIKYQQKELFGWNEKLRRTVQEPYLENDEGVRIRKIGSLKESDHFDYRVELCGEEILFDFWAPKPWSKDHPIYDNYQVDLSSVMTRLEKSSFFRDYNNDELTEFLRTVMRNIREALLNFPDPRPFNPTSSPAPPPIVKVVFCLSLWKRWKEFEDVDFGEQTI